MTYGLGIKWKSCIKNVHISKSILRIWKNGKADKKIRKVSKIQNSKKTTRMGLANQLYNVHTKFHQAKSITTVRRREKVKNVYKKNLNI